MILRFATKRNINGHRTYLEVDTDRKVYAVEANHWLCREDFAEVLKSDLNRIRNQVETLGYTRVDDI